MDFKKFFSLIIISLFFLNSFSQVESKGVPFIKNFNKIEYDGNPQVFNIIQDDRGIMYFANQTYILEFDGTSWHKIYLPKDPTIYSLTKDDNGRIYVGASANELGYLQIDDSGELKYHSLTDLIPEDKKEFTRVPQVHKTKNNHIIFVTPLTIYIYENNTIKTLDVSKPENSFFGSFKVNDRVFIWEKGRGILEYNNGELKLLDGTRDFSSRLQPLGMYPGPNNSLYITCWQDSVRLLSNGVLTNVEKNPLLYNLITPSIYDKKYFLGGLYGAGMVITDGDLNVIKNISTADGIQNSTAWCIYPDKDKNIWLGTNDGISVIYANLPYTWFSENANLGEVVYTSVKYNNILYIGTSSGVFYKDFSKPNTINSGKFVSVDNASNLTQIWKVDTINNTILLASQTGLFQIVDNRAELIGPGVSVKTFVGLKEYPDKILATGGNGLSIFNYKNGKWEFKNKLADLKGYNYIQEDENGYFWISDRSKGVLRLKLSANLDSIVEEKLYGTEDGLPDITGNYVFKVNDKVIFTTVKGIYVFDYSTGKFVIDEDFHKIFNRDIAIDKIFQADNGNIWFKEVIEDPKIKNKLSWELGLIKKTDTGFVVIKTPFYKVRNNIYSINQISDNELIVGTEKGFVLYDLSKAIDFEKPFDAMIRKVEFIKNDSLLFGGTFSDENKNFSLLQDPKKIPQIPHEFNDLRFYFSSAFYEEPEKTQYSFKLVGNDEKWTDWKSITSKEYSNHTPGS